MDEFKKDIVKIVSKTADITDSMLETPPSPGLGDFALPCFALAKEMKKSAAEIAKQIEANSRPTDLVERIVAAGPYVNFFISPSKFAGLVLKGIMKLKNSYGKSLSGKGKTVMIEYSSPSVNKPQHLGHIRNNVLGFSLAEIFEASSHKVIKANLYNDRGIHICKSMLAYKKFGSGKEPDKKPDHFVGDFYVLFNQKAREDGSLSEEAQELLRKWEDGDKETRALWKKMSNWVYRGFEETYSNLGVSFDITYYESDFYDKGKKIVEEALQKGLLKKNAEGAVYCDLEEFGLPEKIVLRADGTSIYATQDIYLAKLKFSQYALDKSVYVIGSEHNLYMQQLFAIIKKLGFDFADRLVHRSYGMVFLPEGKMKSREGTVVEADDIMQKMKALARDEVIKRHGKLSESEVEKRAAAIGLAGLKFFILKQDPAKDIYFDPKESISFEGETGPYVQYAFARACSVLKKFGKPVSGAVDFSRLASESEKKLIRALSQFPDAVEGSLKSLSPSKTAHYLVSLAQSFNEFYHSCPILSEGQGLKKARLFLAYCARQVLGNGMALLGIERLEEM